MSESHHEYMMRTSQEYREFFEGRNRELSDSVPVLEPMQRPKDMWRIRELEEQLHRAEQALVDFQCEKVRLGLALKRETSEGAELEHSLYIAYASRQELLRQNKKQRSRISKLETALEGMVECCDTIGRVIRENAGTNENGQYIFNRNLIDELLEVLEDEV